ncbi:MAG: polysaccharide deacetylase family protein [Planctomycetota bacterium]|nr:polysaccharide deacetylase family protein [Planctomycetota bacterium]
MRAIFMYHSIDPSGSPVSMDREDFRRQVRWMVESEVSVVDFEELLDMPDDADAITLTFDDGFANYATEAWPVLAEHGLPATVFVVSDQVGRTNAWGGVSSPVIPDIPLMSWDQLAEVAETGARIGGHSRTHAHMIDMSADELRDQLETSKERLAEETGQAVSVFAYPYGDYDAKTLQATRGVYDLATTTQHRLLHRDEDRHLLPRVDAGYFCDAERLASFGSPACSRYVRYLDLRVKARQALQFVRGIRP